MEAEHKCFTVDKTAYVSNMTREEMRDCLAIHYQRPSKTTEHGTSIGLRFPFLIVASYIENAQEVADKIASILEEHWERDQ